MSRQNTWGNHIQQKKILDDSQYDFTDIDPSNSILDNTKSFINSQNNTGINKNTIPVFKTKTMGMHRSASCMITVGNELLVEINDEPDLPTVKVSCETNPSEKQHGPNKPTRASKKVAQQLAKKEVIENKTRNKVFNYQDETEPRVQSTHDTQLEFQNGQNANPPPSLNDCVTKVNY